MDVLILMAVADGPIHGYAAIQAVRERADGAVRVSTGSFYRRLSLLMKDGLVEEAPGPKVDDPRRGAYYRVTARPPDSRGGTRAAGRAGGALDGLRPSSRRSRA